MRRRLVLAAAALSVTAPSPAVADGDPASDVLPTQDVYYPYSPQPSKPLVEALDRLLADVRRKGFAMKVALIASPSDLGAYPQLFNTPQEYTNLLAGGLPTNPHGGVKEKLRLLVVMPGGFGGQNLGDRVDEALGEVEIDSEAESDGLVRAAMEAVARLATVNGHQTPVPPEAEAERGGDGVSPLVVVGIGALVLALLAAAVLLRRRFGPSDERPAEPPEAQAEGLETRSP